MLMGVLVGVGFFGGQSIRLLKHHQTVSERMNPRCLALAFFPGFFLEKRQKR